MKFWRLTLLAATGVRLWAAARAPLSADEAYYWVWSHAPAWGYLDHPPMVAVWIRIGCRIIGETPLGVRLLGPVAALLGTLLLARAAEDLAPGRRAGLAAALLFNATLVCNAGAVVMTPDTPLLFFWTAALAALVRLALGRTPNWWLLVGVACGLALDSKYTAVLLAAGVTVWVLIAPARRVWLKSWQLWAGALAAFGLFAPVLAWNAAHGWASFAKQGGRTGDWEPAQALRFLAELLGGQLGLATPIIAVLCGAGMVRAARGLRRAHAANGSESDNTADASESGDAAGLVADSDAGGALLACVTLLPALVFIQHALGGRVQANWPAVIYPGAILAACCLGKNLPRFWRAGTGLGAGISAVVLLQAAVAPLALPRALDFTLIRLGGWADLAGDVYLAKMAAKADFVAADEYGLASELAFRLRGRVAGIEARWSQFDLPRADLGGQSGILVRSEREYGPPDARFWSSIVPAGEISRARSGVLAEKYRLFRVVGAVPQAGPAAAGTVWLREFR